MITFGPVPSRRLGKSLGINNIPALKTCSYSCIYCQVGAACRMSVQRTDMYRPETILEETKRHLGQLKKKDYPDYLTFVSDGEPTLDKRIGESIKLLKTLDIPVAVISNGTLLNDTSVIDDLMNADWVSLKVDAVKQEIWKAVNRPYKTLDIAVIKEAYKKFAAMFKGVLATETMLVAGVNDTEESLKDNAAFIEELGPKTACISIPIRPPAVSSVKAPDEEKIISAYQIYSRSLSNVMLLNQFEGTDTGYTGNAAEDITNMCSVHPIREDTLVELLEKDKAGYGTVDMLLKSGMIKKVRYESHTFYIRSFH